MNRTARPCDTSSVPEAQCVLSSSDTGPINYLALIGRVNTLPALSEKVLIPSVVREELSNQKTPSAVREWIAHPPAWLEVRQPLVHSFDDDLLSSLGEGERAQLSW